MATRITPELREIPVVSAKILEEQRIPLHGEYGFGYTHILGRITEIVCLPSSPYPTVLCDLVREAQSLREPVVWLTMRSVVFFPPDIDANGVDLEALSIVWINDARSAMRAAEHLLRSGCFGLVILDLPPHSLIDQGRIGKLARLAALHQSAVVFVTKFTRNTPYTLGSLVSLRCEVTRKRIATNKFCWILKVIKDRKSAPGWSLMGVCDGPFGLH